MYTTVIWTWTWINYKRILLTLGKPLKMVNKQKKDNICVWVFTYICAGERRENGIIKISIKMTKSKEWKTNKQKGTKNGGKIYRK